MSSAEQNMQNKKQGNGNGNTVINNKTTNSSSKDYVTGDYPSSSSHKLKNQGQNKRKNNYS